ncbi:sulfite exporter TauE/SafE family protein [Celeribacter arenosi]|uniref:Probable membrane transporter protein n=2 Tax=Celeribacter arenosi TaxID=792649 RepID=A0ABP7JUF4_9RHOB
MGAPVIAVPVIASFFDVKIAVALMVLPNFSTNIWQLWTYRSNSIPGMFRWVFAIAGAVGAILGTVMLVNFAASTLKAMIAAAVLGYVFLRVSRPNFAISTTLANRLAIPMGTLAGVLQGAAGVSAPVSVSFLNAMNLSRAVFIPTISLFFVAMTLVQIPLLVAVKVMTPQVLLLGIAALVPLSIGMPIGALAAKSISAKAFDRLVLILLVGLSLKLIADAVL